MVADTAEFAAAMTGRRDLDKTRRSMMDFERHRVAQTRAKLPGPNLLLRYGRLVGTINGTPTLDQDWTAAVQEWLAAALRRDTATVRPLSRCHLDVGWRQGTLANMSSLD